MYIKRKCSSCCQLLQIVPKKLIGIRDGDPLIKTMPTSSGCTFKFFAVCVLLLLFAMVSRHVHAKPSDYGYLNSLDKGGDCKTNLAKRTLCEYCAKRTKSPQVYPDCCASRDEVHTFCEAYVNFGIRE